MSTWAPNVAEVIDKGFGSSRNGNAVVGAITHHVAGGDGKGYVANSNKRNSHPTYHIDKDGRVTGIVHPDRKPSSTVGGPDISCITVEIDNIGGDPDWKVSEAALEAWAIIIAHHAAESSRRDHAIEVNDPKNTQKGFFVGWHSQYGSTACPGNFTRGRIPSIVARANAIKGGSAPAPTPSKPSTPAPSKPSTPAKKSNSVIASEVLRGSWGNGDARKSRLRAAGYDYDAVMREVNAKLKPGSSTPSASAPTSSGLPAGSANFNVRALQQFFKDYYPLYASHIAVDGRWGDQTAGVVGEYQKRKGLVQDRVVGAKQTLPALRKDGFRG